MTATDIFTHHAPGIVEALDRTGRHRIEGVQMLNNWFLTPFDPGSTSSTKTGRPTALTVVVGTECCRRGGITSASRSVSCAGETPAALSIDHYGQAHN